MIQETDNPYPPRSWLQSNIKSLYIITLMIVLPLWLLASFYVFTNQAQRNLHQVIHNDVLLFADSLESELEKYRSIPKMLMMDVALTNSISNKNLFNSSHIHNYLQHIRTTTNSDEVFLLDIQGHTLVSTKFDNEGINAIEWGAYGVPESFLINKNKIIKKYIGPLNKSSMEEIKLFIK